MKVVSESEAWREVGDGEQPEREWVLVTDWDYHQSVCVPTLPPSSVLPACLLYLPTFLSAAAA